MITTMYTTMSGYRQEIIIATSKTYKISNGFNQNCLILRKLVRYPKAEFKLEAFEKLRKAFDGERIVMPRD